MKLAQVFPQIKTQQKNNNFSLTSQLYQPLFQTRTKLITIKSNIYSFTFLNKTISFEKRIDWYPKAPLLWQLNLHYMEFLEDVSDEQFIRIVSDWIENVRPYADRYWLHTWNAYTLSIRVVVWIQQFAKRNNVLPKNFQKALFESLYEQLKFLYHNLELDIQGNHLIKNIKALIWGAQFFESTEVKRWQSIATILLKKQLPIQILSDGMHFELSPAYHCQVFADLLEIYQVGDQEIKLMLVDNVKKMAEVTSNLTHPDGFISLFGDTGMHMAYSPRECLAIYTLLTQQKTTQAKHIKLDSAGYYGYRDENVYFLADCGNIAPDTLVAHGHGDISSFELTLRKQRIFVDPGVFEYSAGSMRDYARSTISHNTVAIDNQSQAEFFGSFRMGRRPSVIQLTHYAENKNGLIIDCEHNGYKKLSPDLVHSREFNLGKNRLIINDTIHGGNGQSVKASFLLHPDLTVELNNKTMTIINDLLRMTMMSSGKISLEDAWWFSDFGVMHHTKKIEIDYLHAPCRGSVSIIWD